MYCFESLTGRSNRGAIVLLKLDGAETLRIEGRPAAACGPGPFTLSNAAATFSR